MVVRLAGAPLSPSARCTRRLTDSCSRLSRPALSALAYATYLAVMAALVAQLTARAAERAEPGDRLIMSGEAAVLTIAVDGPAAWVEVRCATTTDRAPFERLHVSPEQVLDAFQRWCSPAQPVTGE